jgi:hypothetical protein
MTDAALAVTQSAVEQFTEQYLTSIGCSIERRGTRWTVTVPEAVETELDPGRRVLRCSDERSTEDEELLHPESPFFQTVLEDASGNCPVGKLSVDTDRTDVAIPTWLQRSDVELSEMDFSPYYDRTALVLLFTIDIETVSDYQTELLRAVAVDVRSEDVLPGLADVFLEKTSLEGETTESKPPRIEKSRAEKLLDHVRPTVVEAVRPTINDIHQEASRAADAEVEEYRQMQQQRIDELEETVASLSSRIDELNREITRADAREEHVEALKKRKDLKSELDDVEGELVELRTRREQGYPDRQREIRDRHSIEVVVTPRSMTEVEYERGEVEFGLVDGSEREAVTVGYGNGVGVTEDVYCESCNQRLSERNPLSDVSNGLRCRDCEGVNN